MAVTTDKLPDLSKYTDFLNDLKRDFDAKYKFRIGGKDDAIFRALASINTDPARLSQIKSFRTRAVEKLRILGAAGAAMSGQQRVESAIARISASKEAFAVVKDAMANKDSKVKAATIASTANIVITEIGDAVNQYFTGRYNGAGGGGDVAFAKSVRDLLTPLTSAIYTLKNKMAGEGTTFDKGVYKSLQLLKKISAQLQSMPVTLPNGSGGGSSSSIAPTVTSPDGGLDITV